MMNRLIKRNLRHIRLYSVEAGVAESGDLSSREKAMAAALKKDQQEQEKLKHLVELKFQSRDLISKLNKVPTDLINSRLKKLNDQLDTVSPEKVKQLDDELTAFMIENLKLPNEEIANRPWSNITNQKKTIDPLRDSKNSSEGTIKSSSSTSLLNKHPYLKPTSDYNAYSTQELYLRQLNHSRHSGNLGSHVTNVYRPQQDIKNPLTIDELSISKLLAAGCHLGHSKSKWRPSTQPFIYGEYDGIHLIDLNETLTHLKRSLKVIKGVASKGGNVLYVGTTKNSELQYALEQAAKRSNGFYISKKWIPGTITNFTQVIKQPGEKRLEIDMLDNPTNRRLSPSEADELIKPDLIVILNPVENRNCIDECLKARIPTIGLCDTDMEPSLMTYPIPCNDDSIRVSTLMLGLLSKAANEGIEERINTVKSYKKNQRS
ncbi:37S ribosomal protein Mrp4p, mitochondrial [[Candida] jaroonii]|uniref:37S ribosomal protein Mrp4p, mitochondrial n=1 Tax=[Candida] jaroonii TaxID=467808 RepID=A0ACA9YDP3_9ASCO|nr:37S ribosomal protein Mrp4p, mitochondrial [[Candida] jaroonii]